MKQIILLAALALSSVTASAQINFGEAPEMERTVNQITYDGKHNIELQDNGESGFNLRHLIGQEVTYIAISDKTMFNVPDPNSENESWKYKSIDPTPLKYKKFRVVDAADMWICLMEPGKSDSIFANYDLNTNFIVQKHYDLAKSTCVGKTYRNTGASRRLDFFRDYKTRKVYGSSNDNSIPPREDLNCIDVFVDTVHYSTSMTPGNTDWADNVATVEGSRLCLLFETPHYGKIFCPVEESEVLDPEHADNWLNMGPVLTLKKNNNSRTTKKNKQTRRRVRRR